MDLTQGTEKEKRDRAKKMMLWFGIISLIMSFAGLTSAVIIRSREEDWINGFELPSAFAISCLAVIISSITFFLARRMMKSDKKELTSVLLVATFLLGIFFIYNQFKGFQQIIDAGYHFTGPSSSVTTSFIYVIAMLHIAHVVAGLISITVVLVKNFMGKYSSKNMLGIELSENFWHFVGMLWIFLFLFLNYFEEIIAFFN
ncbi:cytochrome c oxidase subunit 3 [Winogradskyella sp. 3972H.M.0a.05]|uniref:cytochrome c oxidase subunit 3 n=1 Tax=Winogradskyella sp. 3972H.M.0a.05 TaxID=2950277 RepID=UPI00339ADD57